MSNYYSYGVQTGLTPCQLFFLVMVDEAVEQLGVTDVVGVAMIIAGWPFLPTRQKPFGTTKGTSIASRLSRKHLPFEIRARILPTLTLASVKQFKIFYTRNIGKFVGRAVPVIGEAIVAYDVVVITRKTILHYNRLVKAEDQVF